MHWILEEFGRWITPEINWIARSSNAVCSKFVSPGPQPGVYAVDVFSQDLLAMSPARRFPRFKHIPQVVSQIVATPGVRVLMGLPYRPRDVCWNLLMKLVKYGRNTTSFRLKMPDRVETRPQFVLTLVYVCARTTDTTGHPNKDQP